MLGSEYIGQTGAHASQQRALITDTIWIQPLRRHD
jgi:hypothetical protein